MSEFYEHKVYKIDDLIPYVNNSRTHSEDQVNQIASSIKEFGWTNPILVDDDGGVIAGHGRIMAARKLGFNEAPCIVLSGLSEAQRKAYVIADNQLALNAGWDEEKLKIELEHLNELDFDLSLTGFDSDYIDSLITDKVEGLVDEDQVPEAPEVPVTQLGDVWVMGNHRLMCGDSTSSDEVSILCGDVPCDMVFTDPPYGMSYGGGRGGKRGSSDGTVKNFGMIKNDDLTGSDLVGLVSSALGNAVGHKKSGSAVYVCFPWRTYSEFEQALIDVGLEIKACIVWNKKSVGLGMAHYRPQHEFIFYCPGDWMGDKSQSDVWSMSRDASTTYVHPTQKPVELIEKALVNSSKSGDIVLDVFGGSGSTLIACQKNNRSARLMELDPIYCDVIVNRWQDFTGQDAIHEVSGKTYQELKYVQI